LVNIYEAEFHPTLSVALLGGILAQLLEAGQLLRHIQLGASFGFQNSDLSIIVLDEEIRNVAREIATRLLQNTIARKPPSQQGDG
jgi:hypothetical protein